MSSLMLRKNDLQSLVAEKNPSNLLFFCSPNSKIEPSNNKNLAKRGYPIISKNDNRKPLRSRVPDSAFPKQKEFAKLVKQWKEETEGSSSISKKLLNIAYLRIIAMGEIAVPLILQELKYNPDHWFIALKAITNADPVSPQASFEQAVHDWLEWGQRQGLID
jgi:hypothetical protein